MTKLLPSLRPETQQDRKPTDNLQASELANVAGNAWGEVGDSTISWQGLSWD